MRPANERRRYTATVSLAGRIHRMIPAESRSSVSQKWTAISHALAIKSYSHWIHIIYIYMCVCARVCVGGGGGFVRKFVDGDTIGVALNIFLIQDHTFENVAKCHPLCQGFNVSTGHRNYVTKFYITCDFWFIFSPVSPYRGEACCDIPPPLKTGMLHLSNLHIWYYGRLEMPEICM